MAIQKSEVFGVGKGNLKENSQTSVITSSQNKILQWSNATAYTVGTVVELTGVLWECLIANIASSPTLSNVNWRFIRDGVKDGDINFVVSGGNSTITQRVDGVWYSFKEEYLPVTLNDNQVAPAVIFSYPVGVYSNMKLEYVAKRGAGETQKRYGTVVILNDGTNVDYSHDFMELGADAGIWLSYIVSGGNVQVRYTSDNLSTPLSFKYRIIGFN